MSGILLSSYVSFWAFKLLSRSTYSCWIHENSPLLTLLECHLVALVTGNCVHVKFTDPDQQPYLRGRLDVRNLCTYEIIDDPTIPTLQFIPYCINVNILLPWSFWAILMKLCSSRHHRFLSGRFFFFFLLLLFCLHFATAFLFLPPPHSLLTIFNLSLWSTLNFTGI